MTYNDIVSKVVNIYKTNNRDERIPRRFILKVLRDSSKQLMSQKLMDRTIHKESNLYTELKCFEFSSQDVIKCPTIEFRRCKTLMRSEEPLPELVFSRLGASIKEIYSINDSFNFTFISKEEYKRNVKREVKIKNQVYIYIGSDNHLYIPDHEIYTLSMEVLTTKPEEVKDCSKDSDCINYWEERFICPDKLVDVVLGQVLQVLGITRQIREDDNPDGRVGN